MHTGAVLQVHRAQQQCQQLLAQADKVTQPTHKATEHGPAGAGRQGFVVCLEAGQMLRAQVLSTQVKLAAEHAQSNQPTQTDL